MKSATAKGQRQSIEHRRLPRVVSADYEQRTVWLEINREILYPSEVLDRNSCESELDGHESKNFIQTLDVIRTLRTGVAFQVRVLRSLKRLANLLVEAEEARTDALNAHSPCLGSN